MDSKTQKNCLDHVIKSRNPTANQVNAIVDNGSSAYSHPPKNVYSGNIQDMIKAVATIAMILDHIGWCILREVSSLRIIGRISMPIFSFFAGYNCHWQYKPPMRRTLLVGLLLSIFLNVFALFNLKAVRIYISPMCTIYFGQWCFYLLPETRNRVNLRLNLVKYLCAMTMYSLLWLVGASTELFDIEYGSLPLLGMMTGYFSRIYTGKDGLHSVAIVRIGIVIKLALYWSCSAYYLRFNWIDSIKSGCLTCLVFIVLTCTNFEYCRPTWNLLKYISRNTLYIYCASIIIPHAWLWYKQWLSRNTSLQ